MNNATEVISCSGKYSNVLRPFFAMMEAELHANTGKGDRPAWLAMSPEQCLLEIYYHTAKLQKAVKNNDMKGVREHTADVANMSMMLADTCGWLDVVSAELADSAPSAPTAEPKPTPCLWKREQDSGLYETGCGQVWHFTDGSTPEENSAYFCHHCGKCLEVQRLIAYQVGDNDIVAAYDPADAIEVLCTYNGYELDEFTAEDVVAVSDALLDSTEAFDQDEGKTVLLEKTLRQELEELTEPAYLHGWE